jgi:hypothetical protein
MDRRELVRAALYTVYFCNILCMYERTKVKAKTRVLKVGGGRRRERVVSSVGGLVSCTCVLLRVWRIIAAGDDGSAQVEDPAQRLRCTVDFLNELMSAPIPLTY